MRVEWEKMSFGWGRVGGKKKKKKKKKGGGIVVKGRKCMEKRTKAKSHGEGERSVDGKR